MKIPAITVALLSLVTLISYLVLAPSANEENNIDRQMQQDNLNEQITEDKLTVSAAEHETRRIKMQEAYAKLELSRKQLKSRANLLKSKMWGVELPNEQAAFVSNNMRQTYSYLKNPAMLGAYFDVKEIEIEQKKIASMRDKLDEIEKILALSKNTEK
jgi:hypothetical protein